MTITGPKLLRDTAGASFTTGSLTGPRLAGGERLREHGHGASLVDRVSRRAVGDERLPVPERDRRVLARAVVELRGLPDPRRRACAVDRDLQWHIGARPDQQRLLDGRAHGGGRAERARRDERRPLADQDPPRLVEVRGDGLLRVGGRVAAHVDAVDRHPVRDQKRRRPRGVGPGGGGREPAQDEQAEQERPLAHPLILWTFANRC